MEYHNPRPEEPRVETWGQFMLALLIGIPIGIAILICLVIAGTLSLFIGFYQAIFKLPANHGSHTTNITTDQLHKL